jgi:hypothetical protein
MINSGKCSENCNSIKFRSEKHETWRKILPNRAILRVRISHKHGTDIPNWLFYEMLRQAGIDKAEFKIILG